MVFWLFGIAANGGVSPGPSSSECAKTEMPGVPGDGFSAPPKMQL
ncbi:MAG: hypothetical protein ACUVYA_12905 [Planctomycetota bacterium]